MAKMPTMDKLNPWENATTLEQIDEQTSLTERDS